MAEQIIPNTRECLTALEQRYPGATFVMETGTHSPWISRLLDAGGHRVPVANARKLRAISQSHTKSDAEDAQVLARLGRAAPARLGPVTHRSEQAQRALLRIKVREALVRSRVNQMTSVRFVLKSLGLTVPSSSKAMSSPTPGNLRTSRGHGLLYSLAPEESQFVKRKPNQPPLPTSGLRPAAADHNVRQNQESHAYSHRVIED